MSWLAVAAICYFNTAFIQITCYMEFEKANILLWVALLLCILQPAESIKVVSSFKELGQHHCSLFPVETLWRIASGTVSQKYGEQYFDFDCYIRQFVRQDGLVIEATLEDEEESEQNTQETGSLPKQLQIDPLVAEYSQGIKDCLPQGVDPIQATYTIWRFFRYLVQHDYVYEWMRAKIRATLGYQSERPNSWMDGDNSAPRLRLDKLFSNQFYDYVDTLMFKDFLYPLVTFFKQNTVIALNGKATESGKPIILQVMETHNLLPKTFEPVVLDLPQGRIFSYTIPGVPLLFSGSTLTFGWSFTGVLVDRSNIEEIETVGSKFYHHDSEQWLKLDSYEVTVPGTGKICKFMYSAYGPLYTKLDREGKNEEYIMRWHEKQNEVRLLFSGLLNFILNDGKLQQNHELEFPFNSIVAINQTGVFQYLCQQFYPSYFLYPDMFGEPQKLSSRWFSYPTKKIIVISNSHLTPTKQQSYDKGEPLSPLDQQVILDFRALKDNKFNPSSLLKFFKSVRTSPQMKKQKQLMMKIYRKVKFFYLPDEKERKKCDQLINILEKWDNSLDDKKIAPIFILWNYFLHEYTFNYVSASRFGAHIVKHRLLTDNYWVNQMVLWEKGTSYGQCDSNQYEMMKDEVNGTGHNSSCYLNILRAFNQTTHILDDKYDGDFSKINLEDFTAKRYFQNTKQNYMADHIQEAFNNYYSKNVQFSAGVDNSAVVYYEGYLEQERHIDLLTLPGSPQEYIDTDL